MDQKKEEFISWVNEKFKPESAKYPVAFIVDDEARITSEAFAIMPDHDEHLVCPVIDYHKGLWIHSMILKKAEEMGFFLEWYNPAYVVVCKY